MRNPMVFNLVTHYSPEGEKMVKVLDDLSFEIMPGEVKWVSEKLGKNKKVVVSLLLKEEKPIIGEINTGPNGAGYISYSFSDYYHHLNAGDNFKIVYLLNGVLLKDVDKTIDDDIGDWFPKKVMDMKPDDMEETEKVMFAFAMVRGRQLDPILFDLSALPVTNEEKEQLVKFSEQYADRYSVGILLI